VKETRLAPTRGGKSNLSVIIRLATETICKYSRASFETASERNDIFMGVKEGRCVEEEIHATIYPFIPHGKDTSAIDLSLDFLSLYICIWKWYMWDVFR